MPAWYTIDKVRRLVLSTGAGVLTAEEMRDHQRRLAADPEFDPSFSQLADFTGVTAVDVTGDEVRALAQTGVFASDSRRALLVTTDVQFGLARMFQILREGRGEHGIQVFRDRDNAMRWVLPEKHSSTETTP